ncbi:putative small nuclear ribonucleoprotein Sm D2 [Plecturocebus cupreus]
MVTDIGSPILASAPPLPPLLPAQVQAQTSATLLVPCPYHAATNSCVRNTEALLLLIPSHSRSRNPGPSANPEAAGAGREDSEARAPGSCIKDSQAAGEQLDKAHGQAVEKVVERSIKNNTQVLINCLNNKKLLGQVKAFHRHCNMVLENMKEMWTEVPKSKPSPSQSTKTTIFPRYSCVGNRLGDSWQSSHPGRQCDSWPARRFLVRSVRDWMPKGSAGPIPTRRTAIGSAEERASTAEPGKAQLCGEGAPPERKLRNRKNFITNKPDIHSETQSERDRSSPSARDQGLTEDECDELTESGFRRWIIRNIQKVDNKKNMF